MTSIDPASGPARLATLARQLAEAVPVARTTTANDAALAGGAKAPATMDAFVATLQSRIAALQPDSSARGKRAASCLVLESLLGHELGAAVTLDLRFQSLVDEVLDAMTSDALVAAEFERAIDLLVERTREGGG